MSGIPSAIGDAIKAAKGALSKALGQDLVKQYTNPDPKNHYACFFTCFYMYFRTVYGLKLSFADYKAACVRAGYMTEDFAIGNRTGMAIAAGHPELICFDTASRIREKIFELLLKGEPVPFSLNGEHYESIDGYETTDTGEIRFSIDDPGWQNDAFADASDLTVYRETSKGRAYSVANDKKSRRVITRVFWFEKK